LWRRALSLCLAVWVSVALALPGEASAHAHRAGASASVAHSQAHAAHGAHAGTEHCGDAANPHAPHPGAPHAGHQTCLDCCCASPAAFDLPPSASAPLAASTDRVAEPAAAPRVPHARGAFLHPFPNGPPPALHA
jgi:hypothetical protein